MAVHAVQRRDGEVGAEGASRPEHPSDAPRGIAQGVQSGGRQAVLACEQSLQCESAQRIGARGVARAVDGDRFACECAAADAVEHDSLDQGHRGRLVFEHAVEVPHLDDRAARLTDAGKHRLGATHARCHHAGLGPEQRDAQLPPFENPGAGSQPLEADRPSNPLVAHRQREIGVAVLDASQLGGDRVDPEDPLDVGNAALGNRSKGQAEQPGELAGAAHRLEAVRLVEALVEQHVGVGPVVTSHVAAGDDVASPRELARRDAGERLERAALEYPGVAGIRQVTAHVAAAAVSVKEAPVAHFVRGPCSGGEGLPCLVPQGGDVGAAPRRSAARLPGDLDRVQPDRERGDSKVEIHRGAGRQGDRLGFPRAVPDGLRAYPIAARRRRGQCKPPTGHGQRSGNLTPEAVEQHHEPPTDRRAGEAVGQLTAGRLGGHDP